MNQQEMSLGCQNPIDVVQDKPTTMNHYKNLKQSHHQNAIRTKPYPVSLLLTQSKIPNFTQNLPSKVSTSTMRVIYILVKDVLKGNVVS